MNKRFQNIFSQDPSRASSFHDWNQHPHQPITTSVCTLHRARRSCRSLPASTRVYARQVSAPCMKRSTAPTSDTSNHFPSPRTVAEYAGHDFSHRPHLLATLRAAANAKATAHALSLSDAYEKRQRQARNSNTSTTVTCGSDTTRVSQASPTPSQVHALVAMHIEQQRLVVLAERQEELARREREAARVTYRETREAFRMSRSALQARLLNGCSGRVRHATSPEPSRSS